MTAESNIVLATRGVTKHFGGFTALENINVEVQARTIHAVIGPNGAGKTTFFNLISGMLRQDDGAIQFKGETIDRLRPNQRTVRGLARTFQNIRLFEDLTVLENVLVAEHPRQFSSTWQALSHAIFHPPFRLDSNEREMRERGHEILGFVGLGEMADAMATDLPYGQRRKLEVARALATDPALLLLDEPAAGMNPAETEEMDELIVRIRDRGVTVLLVEHDMNLVMGISDYVTVFNFGRKIAEGRPEEVQENDDVIAAYLGTGEEI